MKRRIECGDEVKENVHHFVSEKKNADAVNEDVFFSLYRVKIHKMPSVYSIMENKCIKYLILLIELYRINGVLFLIYFLHFK